MSKANLLRVAGIFIFIASLLFINDVSFTGFAVIDLSEVSEYDKNIVLTFEEAGSQTVNLVFQPFEYSTASFILEGSTVKGNYPLQPTVDIFNDGVDWSYSRVFLGKTKIDFTEALLDHCREGNCQVPITITSASAGVIILNNFNIVTEEAKIAGPVIVPLEDRIKDFVLNVFLPYVKPSLAAIGNIYIASKEKSFETFALAGDKLGVGAGFMQSTAKRYAPQVVDVDKIIKTYSVSGLDKGGSAVALSLDFVGGYVSFGLNTAVSYSTDFIVNTYAPLSVKGFSWMLINWVLFLYVLVTVILIFGVIYASQHYESFKAYEEFRSFKHEKERELKDFIHEGKRKISSFERGIEKRKKEKEAMKDAEENVKVQEENEMEIQGLKKEHVDKLNLFLQDSVSRGYNEDKSKQLLKEAGWDKRFVNKYCKEFYEANAMEVEVVKQEIPVTERMNFLDAYIQKLDQQLESKTIPSKSRKYKEEKKKKVFKERKPSKTKIKQDEKREKEVQNNLDLLKMQMENLDSNLKNLK